LGAVSLGGNATCVAMDGCGSLLEEPLDRDADVSDFNVIGLAMSYYATSFPVTLTGSGIVLDVVGFFSKSRISCSQSRSGSSGFRAPSLANRSAHSLPSIPT